MSIAVLTETTDPSATRPAEVTPTPRSRARTGAIGTK